MYQQVTSIPAGNEIRISNLTAQLITASVNLADVMLRFAIDVKGTYSQPFKDIV